MRISIVQLLLLKSSIIICSIIFSTYSFKYTGRFDNMFERQNKNKPEIRILFVGNSITYTNNLPALVQKEANLRGINVKTEMVAFPNYGLQDHWDNHTFQERIKAGNYDYMVIQQGPSSQKDGRESLLKFGSLYKQLCLQYDTELVFFMVWPSRQYYSTFDGVIQNYSDAAKINKILLCPVGEIWKDYFDKTKNYNYYGPDGFHPSHEGSLSASEIIVDSLFDNK